MTRGPFVYVLNPSDRIIRMNQAWDDFATENHASHLMRDLVKDKSLWDFVREKKVRTLYRELFHHVRQTGRTIVIPFRCDAPALRRYMEMKLGAGPEGFIEVFCTIVKTESRHPVEVGLQDPGSNKTLRMCSWCKRIEVTAGGWLELEEGIREVHEIFGESSPNISHGACPECQASILATVRKF